VVDQPVGGAAEHHALDGTPAAGAAHEQVHVVGEPLEPVARPVDDRLDAAADDEGPEPRLLSSGEHGSSAPLGVPRTPIGAAESLRETTVTVRRIARMAARSCAGIVVP
jgi:hypothetical protein